MADLAQESLTRPPEPVPAPRLPEGSARTGEANSGNEPGKKNVTSSRILKVWFYAAINFALISGLAVSMTGEPKTILVAAFPAVVMGLLGTMMAIFSAPKTAKHKVASA
jgi:hypothetical protein